MVKATKIRQVDATTSQEEYIMCIGIPVKLVERDGCVGIGEIEGVRRHISLTMIPEATTGNYILVHAGCGMQVIDEQAAEETLCFLRELENEAY